MGYSADSVGRRVTQLILKNSYREMLRALVADEAALERNYKFKISIVRRLTETRRFFMYSIAYLGAVVLAALKRQGSPGERFSIFLAPSLELSLAEENLEELFLVYCKEGPLEILRPFEGRLIVQDLSRRRRNLGHVVFDRNPYLRVIRETRWSFADVWKMFASTLRTSLVFCRQVIVRPEIALLSRDFGLHPLISAFDRKNVLMDIIHTNSSFDDQEIWLTTPGPRSYASHMLWYSTNTRQFRYEKSRYESDAPLMSYIAVDHAWVWTSDYAAWLRKTAKVREFHVVGPILFYLPTKEEVTAEFDVLIFDVTPVAESWFKENYVTGFYYYYQRKNVEKFVRDVMDLQILEKPLKVALKHKRSHSPIHDPQYIAFVDDCVRRGMTLVAPSESVFELVKKARVTVTLPFSAPSFVADSLGRPALYYDPSGELARPDWLPSSVGFAQTKEELHEKMRSILEG